MARRKVRGLDEALNELFADFEKSQTEAMKYAAEKAKKAITDKAISCLEDYYLNYDPNDYRRTENLLDAFVPYMNVSRVGNSIEASVGMGYWPFMLEGAYNDGSKQWRPVDGLWVLENYLQGIHPATDGSTYIGAAYTPISDGEGNSPDDKMEKYLNEYIDIFNNNVLASFAKQITRR